MAKLTKLAGRFLEALRDQGYTATFDIGDLIIVRRDGSRYEIPRELLTSTQYEVLLRAAISGFATRDGRFHTGTVLRDEPPPGRN